MFFFSVGYLTVTYSLLLVNTKVLQLYRILNKYKTCYFSMPLPVKKSVMAKLNKNLLYADLRIFLFLITATQTRPLPSNASVETPPRKTWTIWREDWDEKPVVRVQLAVEFTSRTSLADIICKTCMNWWTQKEGNSNYVRGYGFKKKTS